MIPKGLFTQLAMVILAGGIAFTYVMPTFAVIEEKQDEIAIYQEELLKVEEVNNKLVSLVAQDNSISSADRARLLAYMPNRVDEVAVMRELSFMVQESGMTIGDLQFAADGRSQSRNQSTAVPTISRAVSLVPHTFSLRVDGAYDQLKELLTLLSQNHYPLEVHELSISNAEEGFLTAEMTLVTYAIEVQAAE